MRKSGESIPYPGYPRIPEWTDSWYVDLGSLATTSQRRAYFDQWRECFEAGTPLDVQENVGYVFAYMRQAIDRFKRTSAIDELRRCFERIETAYGGNADILLFARRWMIHAYLYLRDYCGAWDSILRSRFYDNCDIADVIFYDHECGGISLDGFTLLGLLRNETALTEVGETYRSEIADVATGFLTDFQTQHQCNVIRHLYDKFTSACSTEEAHVKMECVKVLEPFSGSPGGVFQKRYVPKFQLRQDGVIVYETAPLSIQTEILGVLRRIVRESENAVRKRHGLPKVGEGWVSETELFRALSERFPKEKVVQHARPGWLGRQHLDIYFPDRNVAVEYQGAQHERPIEFYGGKKAFEKQQERDERKRRRCEQNGCILIYAHPERSIKDIVELICRATERQGDAAREEYSDD